MKSLFPNNTTAKGFTLMEVMVSVSIFAVIITIGIGSLLTIFKTLEKTRADRQTIDSLSYVLDTMTRRIRTASLVTVPSDSEIILTDQDGTVDVKYYIQDVDGHLRLLMIDPSVQIDAPFDLTPENFTIDPGNITFHYFNEVNNQGQGLLEINLYGTVQGGNGVETKLGVQTAVSKRILDYTE